MRERSAPDQISDPIRSMETGGFMLTERVHPAGWTLPGHCHQSMIIGVVYQGLYTETIGGRSRECGPHSVQLLPAGESHSYAFGRAEVRCLTVEVKPRMLDAIRQFSSVPERPAHVRGGALSLLLTRLYREFRLGDSTAVISAEGLVLETLGSAARLCERYERRSSCAPPRWLRQAREFVHERASKGVSLIDVAASVGIAPAHLAREFRRFYLCSVGEYVRRLRLERAVRELTRTDKPLAEVALEAGFYDQSHMTHAFKLNLQMTPAECRAAARAGHADTKGSRPSKTS